MPSHIDKNHGTRDISHDLDVSYCICEHQIMERRWPRSTLYCSLCDRRCPNEEAIHQALINSKMESIEVLRKRKFKKTNICNAKIEAVLKEGLSQPSVKALMDLYGTDIFHSVVRRLWMRGKFSTGYTAPSLDCDIPEHDAEEKPISEKPAEDTSEKSDWELLVPADAPAEASAYDPEEEAPAEPVPAEEAPTEDAPAAYEASPEEELPTVEACPVEVYDEDPPAEAKPTEAVALRTWMDQFLSIQHTFDTEPSRDLLQSVIGIQDTVVNRTPIGSSSMKKFLDDAVELAY
ncbi:hypothetical protein FLAG1_11785 [Fusarium langsethiae]|uniref:Uncharacterized protein n=1 Tax=Fusarium langsethiae TaxID=179993 RepID=A0A0M9ELH5_FUSLA|nr:hypothetical protein FLAG1_11785 [Fusarium langsethiae]GKU15612.1 unnamed protein product [Fusarium langsethiae]